MANGNKIGSVEPVQPGGGVDGGVNNNDGNINGIAVEPISTPGKRGPGRPAGSANGSGKRSHHRASGTPRAPEEKTKRVDLETLTGIIETIHDLAALASGSEKWKLDTMECERLAKALQGLQKYYPSIDLPGVVLAWVNLGTAVSTVYGPRLGSIMFDAKAKAASPSGRPFAVGQ